MNDFSGKTLLMMAGGTGGHVYPALAVAKAAAAQGATIHWLGNPERFEGKAVPEAGFPLHDIHVRGLRGNGIVGWLKAPWMLLRAIFSAHRVIARIRPDVVIGMGGFAAGPGGVAAWINRIPLLIHEQNAVMGMTNHWLSKLANIVLLADKRAAAKLSRKRTFRVVGNPVREDIAALPEPEIRYQERNGAIRLLVLGGSQGAKALNESLPQALALLPPAQRPQVTHQVGPAWLEAAENAYRDAGVDAQVVPFIEDMPKAYAQADWILARSGALTVAEIATVGIPAVFIPFPYAVDDHQTANASALVEVGAAEVIPQSEMTAELLAGAILQRQNRAVLCEQAENARRCSHARALAEIVAAVQELIDS